nr:MAG TPA: antimicrobial peptide [Caudoviricetes sp.]
MCESCVYISYIIIPFRRALCNGCYFYTQKEV